MEEVFSPLPNTKKYINSKYNDYNPDEILMKTQTQWLRKDGVIGCALGRNNFQVKKKGAAVFRGNVVC